MCSLTETTRDEPTADTRPAEPTAPSTAPSPQLDRASAIYAAVIRQLVTRELTAAPDARVIYVMDEVIEDAAKPLRGWHDPESSFDQTLKEEVAGELSDVAPVAFIAERESVVKGDESRSPGQVRNGGVLISLGPVRGAGKGSKSVATGGWMERPVSGSRTFSNVAATLGR
jgi:hypothetical protein